MKFIVLFSNGNYKKVGEFSLEFLKELGHVPGICNKFIEPVLFLIFGYKFLNDESRIVNTVDIMTNKLISLGVNLGQIIPDQNYNNKTVNIDIIESIYLIVSKFEKLPAEEKYYKYYTPDEYSKKYFTVEFDDFLPGMENDIEINIIATGSTYLSFLKIFNIMSDKKLTKYMHLNGEIKLIYKLHDIN